MSALLLHLMPPEIAPVLPGSLFKVELHYLCDNFLLAGSNTLPGQILTCGVPGDPSELKTTLQRL